MTLLWNEIHTQKRNKPGENNYDDVRKVLFNTPTDRYHLKEIIRDILKHLSTKCDKSDV